MSWETISGIGCTKHRQVSQLAWLLPRPLRRFSLRDVSRTHHSCRTSMRQLRVSSEQGRLTVFSTSNLANWQSWNSISKFDIKSTRPFQTKILKFSKKKATHSRMIAAEFDTMEKNLETLKFLFWSLLPLAQSTFWTRWFLSRKSSRNIPSVFGLSVYSALRLLITTAAYYTSLYSSVYMQPNVLVPFYRFWFLVAFFFFSRLHAFFVWYAAACFVFILIPCRCL